MMAEALIYMDDDDDDDGNIGDNIVIAVLQLHLQWESKKRQ
jgi:hypothetical protein